MNTSPYLKELYSDYTTKQSSIKKYVGRVDETSRAIEAEVYQWLTLLKKKHEVINEFRQSRRKSVPSSQFALEDAQQDQKQTTNTDLKKLEAVIQDKAQLINHMFQKVEKEMMFLTQSYKQLAEIVNEVSDTFDASFKGI